MGASGWPLVKMAFSPDGKRLAVAASYLTIVDAESGDRIRDDPIRVVTLAFDREGTLAVAGADNFQLRTGPDWKESQQRLPWVKGVRCIAMAPDGKTIAWGGHDNAVYLWERGTSKPPKILRGHQHWIESLVFHPDGKQLVINSGDGTVKFWDLTQPRQEFRTLEGSVAAFGSGGELIVGRGQKLDAQEPIGAPIKKQVPFDEEISALERSPDGKWLAMGGNKGLLKL